MRSLHNFYCIWWSWLIKRIPYNTFWVMTIRISLTVCSHWIINILVFTVAVIEFWQIIENPITLLACIKSTNHSITSDRKRVMSGLVDRIIISWKLILLKSSLTVPCCHHKTCLIIDRIFHYFSLTFLVLWTTVAYRLWISIEVIITVHTWYFFK